MKRSVHRVENLISQTLDLRLKHVAGCWISDGGETEETEPFHQDLKVIEDTIGEVQSRTAELHVTFVLFGFSLFDVARSRPIDLIETIAALNTTVLIQGETGTGKELIARAMHFNSPRRDHKLVSINCGAIPENLLESELFGHVKGAFTGAIQTRIGRFEQADGGTLFLDEIGNMPPTLQVKLLRVLQEREFERVGGSSTVKIDVRIIAATSANLDEMVREKTFRKDLFYRLNVIPVDLPPLRERREDIPLLIQRFVRQFSDILGFEVKSVAPEVVKGLMAYDWPGNVRQFENIVERMVALTGQRPSILGEDLPQEIRNRSDALLPPTINIPDEGINFQNVVSGMERELIVQSLRKTGGNKKLAAKLLNLKRTTLIEKIKRIGLEQKTLDPVETTTVVG